MLTKNESARFWEDTCSGIDGLICPTGLQSCIREEAVWMSSFEARPSTSHGIENRMRSEVPIEFKDFRLSHRNAGAFDRPVFRPGRDD